MKILKSWVLFNENKNDENISDSKRKSIINKAKKNIMSDKKDITDIKVQDKYIAKVCKEDGIDVNDFYNTDKKSLNKMFNVFNNKVNEDLSSKYRDEIDDEIDDDEIQNEFSEPDYEEHEEKELRILEIQGELEEYNPNFKYDDYEVDSQEENNGIVNTTVWIEFLGVDDVRNMSFDALEKDFLLKTHFDEVEILSRDTSILFSINIYEWDLRKSSF